MSNSADPDETAQSLSRLIWIYAVCKSLLLSPVAVKELKEYRKHYHAAELDAIQKYMIEHMWSSNEN